MKIYPAIDLQDGKVVRLFKGDFQQVTEYGEPLEIAHAFEKAGAKHLHIVDLDGAKSGNIKNLGAILDIVSRTNLKCELGGGIRNLSQIQLLLSKGIDRVILGSAALDLEFVKDCVHKYGERIVVGIDTKDFKIATHGWLIETDLDALKFAQMMEFIGVKTIIFTDIAKDGTMTGINFEQTKKLVDGTSLKVVASGGATSIEDVEKAKEIGCDGIILGKSLYTNAISLEEALEYEVDLDAC